ncbi:helix-turn-helix transcriptional regulator [Janthinobacterium sp.]|uniref:ArsR/SmtB family transcription factor n=1 Tax=Janthinobacterium sp. TaxID=1871054 RepID=UPI00293D5DA6|nr:helix-turn-helix transcriptional regulator [Janthinobacterium sp.]
MDANHPDTRLSAIAGAIAEPARARMLCCLLDGRARTSTELSAVAGVSPSTASAHLNRLREQRLVDVLAQGKHRYHRLAGEDVGKALEALLVLAGLPRPAFQPNTPSRLRHARTCYDHMAGTVAVALHDHLAAQGCLLAGAPDGGDYLLSAAGAARLERLGVDLPALRKLRRRFACACLDWSERRPHIGGALGAALLQLALRRGWAERDLDGRALSVSAAGQRRMLAAFAPD